MELFVAREKGLVCSKCGTSDLVEYRHNGKNYCKKCIIEIDKVEDKNVYIMAKKSNTI